MTGDMSRCRSCVIRSLFVVAFSGLILVVVQFYRKTPSPVDGYRHVTNDNMRHTSFDDLNRLLQRNDETSKNQQQQQHLLDHENSLSSAGRQDRPMLQLSSESINKFNTDSASHVTVRSDAERHAEVAPNIVSQSSHNGADIRAGEQSSSSSSEDSSLLWRRFNEVRNRSSVVDSSARSQGSPDAGFPANDGSRNIDNRPAMVPAAAEPSPATAAAENPRSQSPGGQQQNYIPHRCPPTFDKINDTEYDWFLQKVVQRSPANSHSASTFNDEILILTPISNSAKHLKRYFENICSLVYPHRLISIVLGEDSSSDDTVKTAQQMVDELGSFFRRVELVRLPKSSRSL
jgi:Anp1